MKLNFLKISIIFCVILVSKVKAENQFVWEKSFGGTKYDEPRKIIKNEEGDFLIIGYTKSEDLDVKNPRGNEDVWLIKIDNNGLIKWKKNYGGSGDDFGNSIVETDSGYVVAGYSRSIDFDVTNNYGNKDAWLFEIDNNGEIINEKNYGGSNTDYATSILKLEDNGYLVAGSTQSIDFDISKHYGKSDGWLFKVDSNFNLEWERTYGGKGTDLINDFLVTSDGDFLVCGQTRSFNDIELPESKFWVFKIDKLGNIIWEKIIGGNLEDKAFSVIETENKNFIVVGYTRSSSGHVNSQKGGGDIWVTRFDANGNLEWEETYGGSSTDLARVVKELEDGSIIIGGSTSSTDINLEGMKDSITEDYWLFKLNLSGEIEWSETFGGKNIDRLYDIEFNDKGDIYLVGWSNSNEEDRKNYKGTRDFWAVKYNNSKLSLAPDNINLKNPFFVTNDNNRIKIYFNSSSEILLNAKIISQSGSILKNINSEIVNNLQNKRASEIDLSWLSTGLYLITISTNKSLYTYKFLVWE